MNHNKICEICGNEADSYSNLCDDCREQQLPATCHICNEPIISGHLDKDNMPVCDDCVKDMRNIKS